LIRKLLLVATIFYTNSLLIQAQVPVYQEPYHRLVLSRPEARIMDVRTNPGDTTAFHIHADDICYVTINGSDAWLNEPNGSSRVVTLADGWVGSNITYSDSSFVHRFANVGNSLYRLIAIENLSAKSEQVKDDSDKDDNTILNNSRFQVRKIELAPLSTKSLTDKYSNNVVIKFNGIDVLVKGRDITLTDENNWIWLDPDIELILENKSEYSISMFVVKIKNN